MNNNGFRIRFLILAAAIAALLFWSLGTAGRVSLAAAGFYMAAETPVNGENNDDLPRGAGVTEQY